MLSTVPRLFAAALFAVVFAVFLALAIAPARSAETATANDTARFLAGLPPAPDSPLAALAKDPGWAQHARFFDSIFTREDANTLAKVRAFSKEHLTPQHDTMLYMFSGPDFLYATSFFPSASTYVLSGLEPVGAVPQLTNLPRGTVDLSLRNIEGSLGSILNLSFFITKNMKTQLTAGPVYGTLPILYVFLARTGKTVHEVSLVNVDGQGNVVAPEDPGTKQRAATQSAAKGVKIVFSDGSGPRQTLYYFSTDLSDGGVKSSGFLQFCAKLGVADSFIKSASYLLHSGGFTRVRRFPDRPQCHHSPGRQRHSARLFRCEAMALAAVRPLSAPAGHLPQCLSAGHGGAVPQGRPARLRDRLSVAQERVEPLAGDTDSTGAERGRN